MEPPPAPFLRGDTVSGMCEYASLTGGSHVELFGFLAGRGSARLLGTGREEVVREVTEGRVVDAWNERILLGVLESHGSAVDALLDVVLDDEVSSCHIAA